MSQHSHPVLRSSLAFAALLAAQLITGIPAAAQEKPQTPPGDEGIPLRWRFAPGKAFYQEVTYEVTQTMKVQGMEVKSPQSYTLWSRWEPLKQEGGKWALKQTVLGAKIDLGRGTPPYLYDKGPPDPSDQALDQLRGASFVVTLGPDFRVAKVEGVEAFLQRAFRNKPAEVKRIAQTILPVLLDMGTTGTFSIGPADGRKVKRGESWTRKSSTDAGPVGKWAGAARYTYQGKDECYDKIAVETTLKYEPPATDAAATFRLKELRLGRAGGPGVILFDSTRGRLVRSAVEVRIEGTFIVASGGLETEVWLSQRQKTTIKITDTNPLK
jgi:hypothetical protein